MPEAQKRSLYASTRNNSNDPYKTGIIVNLQYPARNLGHRGSPDLLQVQSWHVTVRV